MNKNKIIFSISAIVALAIISIVSYRIMVPQETVAEQQDKPASAEAASQLEKVVVRTKSGKEHAFEVLVADSHAEKARGLMFVKSMDADKGMLFEMSSAPALTRFWMKNTYIPLDMLFIDEKGIVKKIHKNATPHSTDVISSDFPITGVLEINGGLSDKLGINEGDVIKHSYFKNN